MGIGFMVIQEDGTPVFTYVQEAQQDVAQSLLPSLLGVLQMFTKGVLPSEKTSGVKSLTLADTVYTIRNLNIQTPSRKENIIHFVLLKDTNRKIPDIESLLDYLVISFLGYNKGEYVVKVRINAIHEDEFSDFNEFMLGVMDLKTGEIKKTRVSPPPSSFIQGMLNEVCEYFPVEDMEKWNPKLLALGKSYVWVSDELSKEEEEQILQKIKTNLSEGLYNTLVDRVKNQLN